MGIWRSALVAGLALGSGCGDEPCGSMSGQTVDDCDSVPATRLTIEIKGPGRGWVQVMEGTSVIKPVPGTGLVCTQTCTLDVPATAAMNGVIVLRAGTTQRITGSSCGLEDYDRECVIVRPVKDVSITFGTDPEEVSTLFLEDPVRALAFVSDGDLVMGSPAWLRRVAVDGTERWSVPRAGSLKLATTADDLIVVGPEVAAFRANGSLAWTAPYQATVVTSLPDGSPLILTTAGRVIALSAANGSPIWQSADLGATTLTVDDTGTVAAGTGLMIVRFDASGASLPSWQAPAAIDHLFTDDTGALAVTQLKPPEGAIGSPDTTLDYYRFDTTGVAAKAYTMTSLAPHGFAVAGDRLLHWARSTLSVGSYPVRPPLLVLSDFRGNSLTWQLIKGIGIGFKQTYGADLITPDAAACNDARRCAVAGNYDAPTGAGMANWVGVYKLP